MAHNGDRNRVAWSTTARRLVRRLDPAQWPPNGSIVAAIVWLAWLALCLAVPALMWTALPMGGAIAWRCVGHGVVPILSWTVPLAAILALLQGWDLLPTSAPTDHALTIGLLVAAAATAIMVLDHAVQLRWLELLPASSLDQPWIVRVEVRRFEVASIAANRVVAQAHGGAPSELLIRRTRQLQLRAERSAASSSTWRTAWRAHINWLRALEEAFADADSSVGGGGGTVAVVAALNAAIEAAAAETRRIDPLGVSIETQEPP